MTDQNSMTEQNASAPYKRRRKLVRLDLQVKIVFITLFVTSLVLLINFQLNLAGLWSLSGSFSESQEANALIEAYRQATVQRFLLSVGLAVPLAAAVGILYSFKFCGPIFRFNQYFGQLSSGNWAQVLRLRKGDDLLDVCDSINEGVGCLLDQIRSNHLVHQQVKSFFESHPELVNDANRADIETLQVAIAKEQAVFVSSMTPQEDRSSPSNDSEAGAESESDVSSGEESRGKELAKQS